MDPILSQLRAQIEKNDAEGNNRAGGFWSAFAAANKTGLIYRGRSRSSDPFVDGGGVFIASNCGLALMGERVLRPTRALVFYLGPIGCVFSDCPNCRLPCCVVSDFGGAERRRSDCCFSSL